MQNRLTLQGGIRTGGRTLASACLPILIATSFLAPLVRAQSTADLAAQLNSIRENLGPASPALGARLSSICGSPSTLVPCENWAVRAAEDLRLDGASRSLETAAAILSALRQVRHQMNGPASENVSLVIKLGEVYLAQGNYADAEPLFLMAGAPKTAAPDRLLTATALHDLAALYVGQRAYDKAEPLYLQALEIRQHLLGPDDPDIAVVLNGLADLYDAQRKTSKAVSLYRQALAILEKSAPESLATATVLNNLAETYHTNAAYQDAEPLYLRALRILEKVAGADSPDTATALDNLAGLYDDEGAYAKALPIRLRALDIKRKRLGLEHRSTALSFDNLGVLYYYLGEYAKAEECYRQALAIREKILPSEHLEIGMSLEHLGQILAGQGAYGAAESLYKRALGIREKALPPEHPDLALSLDNLASLYNTQGDFARAEPLFRRALAIREKALPPDHPDLAISLSNLGVLYSAQGAYDKAEAALKRALALDETEHGPDHRDTAAVVNNLAELFRLKGELQKAEPYSVRALAILEKTLPPGHWNIAAATSNLALLYAAQGAYSKAEPLYLRALAMEERTVEPDQADLAVTRSDLAGLYTLQKDFAKAEALYVDALSSLEHAWGADHPKTASIRIDYAHELWQMGKRREARDQLMAANRAVGGFWSHNLIAVEETRRMSLVKHFDDLSPFSLTIAGELVRDDPAGAAALAALAVAERKGIRSSARQEVFARIRRDENPETLRLFGQLIANAGQQSGLSRQGGAEAGRRLRQLRENEGEIERKLIDRSASYREWREAFDPRRISEQLAPGTAFIDVLRFPQVDLVTGKVIDFRYVAVVYRAGLDPKLSFLGPAAPIESAVRNLRSNFENMWRVCTPQDTCAPGVQRLLISGAQFRANLDHTKTDCAVLYRLTMAPLREYLGNAKRLIVSPDGALAEVPWEILRNDSGRYLVDDNYRITYLDSARSIVHPRAQSSPRNPAVVIAQVDYDGKSETTGLASTNEPFPWDTEEIPAGQQDPGFAGRWKPLRGGEQILRTLDDLRKAGRLAPIEKLPLGSKQEVMALDRPLALIAHTHGFFRASGSESRPGAIGLNAGIVLYGANRASETNRGDGWLTAKEVMLLKLEGTEFVALLGCDTGRGVEAGEGVQGLRHALTVAGARSTLLTLWQVGDLSAARLLGEMLTRSVSGGRKTLAEALAETQLAFLRSEVREPNATADSNRWRHPYFWAGPTLAGEAGVLHLRTAPRP